MAGDDQRVSFLRLPINCQYHTWIRRIRELRPEQRITQIRNFAWLLVGIHHSRSVTLSKIAGFFRTARADDEMRHFLIGAVEYLSSFSEEDIEVPVTVFSRVNMCGPYNSLQNGWRFYGSEGTIIGDGLFTLSLSQQLDSGSETLPIPEEIVMALPDIGDEIENKWAAMFRDFVADIQSEPHEPYLTFQDGWRFQGIIDAIRYGKGWFQVPELPSGGTSVNSYSK